MASVLFGALGLSPAAAPAASSAATASATAASAAAAAAAASAAAAAAKAKTSQASRAAASAAAAAAAAAAAGGAAGARAPLDWSAYNWPTSREVGGLPLGVIHFDLEELRAKRDAAVFALARDAYRWWQLTVAIALVNFGDCVGLAAAAPGAYPSVNVLFSLLWAAAWAAGGMAVVYHAYKGFAEDSAASKLAARAGAAAAAPLIAIMALGAFGSVNGLASLGGPRLQGDFARAGASPAAQRLWTGLVVLESLLWLADAAVFAWVARRIFRGPTAANAPVALA